LQIKSAAFSVFVDYEGFCRTLAEGKVSEPTRIKRTLKVDNLNQAACRCGSGKNFRRNHIRE